MHKELRKWIIVKICIVPCSLHVSLSSLLLIHFPHISNASKIHRSHSFATNSEIAISNVGIRDRRPGPWVLHHRQEMLLGSRKRLTLKYFKMASCWHKKEMERDRQSKEKEGSRETGRDNTLYGTIGYSSVSPIEPFISTTRQYIKHSQEEIKIGDLWRPEHHMILPITLKLH